MADAPVPTARGPGKWMWVLGWLVASIVFAALARRYDWPSALGRLRLANPSWLALAVVANFAVVPLLGFQWRLLAPRYARGKVAAFNESAAVGLAVMNTVPFGGGHAVAVGLLGTRAGLGFEGALAMVALEQLCEGVAKLSVFLLALAVAPLPTAVAVSAWILAIAVAIGFGLVFWLSTPTAGSGSAWRSRLSGHLSSVRDRAAFAGALALGIGTKIVQLAAIWAVQRSFGVVLPLSTLPVLLIAVSIASMVSVTPGNLGIFEAAAFATYRLFGVDPEVALALAVAQHACFWLAMVVPGYLVMLWRSLALAQPPNAPRAP